ncbi:DUF2231 domain-containing protein [Amycolatopsis taiwanensis]|uniref:DUF2231 domain-containing protein n=1 Tax=Amycolatopsis taiwanensis TaxID=342230 RepID=UPI0004820581|nr:DUF2231 domain-containing protein [Amycolatopsis taiwanensis]
MPTFISGLPVHVLVVHAVVVLVPLSVLGTITIAAWPAARRRYGWLVVGVTALATLSIPLATSSGEDLRDRLPRTSLIRTHASLGDELLFFVAALLVVAAALVWFDQRRRQSEAGTGSEKETGSVALKVVGVPVKVVAGTLTALTVALAVVSAVQVVRIGDSGAKAAWSGEQYISPQPHEG